MNLLSSRVKKGDLDRHMKNFYRVVAGIKGYFSYRSPSQFMLGGTPLYESMISLHKIIPHFQSTNKIQKVQCIILTDGDGHPVPVSLEKKTITETCCDTSKPMVGMCISVTVRQVLLIS